MVNSAYVFVAVISSSVLIGRMSHQYAARPVDDRRHPVSAQESCVTDRVEAGELGRALETCPACRLLVGAGHRLADGMVFCERVGRPVHLPVDLRRMLAKPLIQLELVRLGLTSEFLFVVGARIARVDAANLHQLADGLYNLVLHAVDDLENFLLLSGVAMTPLRQETERN